MYIDTAHISFTAYPVGILPEFSFWYEPYRKNKLSPNIWIYVIDGPGHLVATIMDGSLSIFDGENTHEVSPPFLAYVILVGPKILRF